MYNWGMFRIFILISVVKLRLNLSSVEVFFRFQYHV
jgi:hypothetical protein